MSDMSAAEIERVMADNERLQANQLNEIRAKEQAMIAREKAEAALADIQVALAEGFMVCGSGGNGRPYVKIEYEKLPAAQNLHRRLVALATPEAKQIREDPIKAGGIRYPDVMTTWEAPHGH